MLLEPHKKQAGAVSALSGSIQMCLAGLLGGYLVETWVTTHVQLGWFYMASGSVMGLVLFASNKHRIEKSSDSKQYAS
jgi:hypothetical protein